MSSEHAIAMDFGELDPVISNVLEQLWTASCEASEKPWTVAKLSKRSGLPMSTLRRVLTMLQLEGLVDSRIGEDGRGSAALTQRGVALCAMLSGTDLGAIEP